MRRLLLLRHAKTERPQPGERDHDRKLTERGRADAPIIGAYMAHHRVVPDIALVSPATRAEQTWALMATAFRKSPRVVMEQRLYNAAAETLIEIITATDDARTVLIVGHNPGMQDLAVQLIASGDVETRERIKEKLPTCGLVVLDFPFDDWSRLRPSSGRLDRFVSPRLIGKATD